MSRFFCVAGSTMLVFTLVGCGGPSSTLTSNAPEVPVLESQAGSDPAVVETIQSTTEFSMPGSPEEMVAQIQRAIELEDHEAVSQLIYRSETTNGGMTPEERLKRSESLFEAKKHGLTRIVVLPLQKPIPDRIMNRTGKDGIRLTMKPDPTHDIRFEYNTQLKSGSRTSGFYVGVEEGVYYLSNAQPVE